MTEQAFPGVTHHDNGRDQWRTSQEGMTLRDYFAAKALEGDWAAQSPESGEWNSHQNPVQATHMEARARLYYCMADAMLAARAQP